MNKYYFDYIQWLKDSGKTILSFPINIVVSIGACCIQLFMQLKYDFSNNKHTIYKKD